MPPDNKLDSLMLQQLISGLEATHNLANSLLAEIRESESDFAVFKTELKTMHESVKSLSRIVREGNGDMSLLTKIALIEQQIKSIESWIDKHKSATRAQLQKLNKEVEEITVRVVLLEKYVEASEEHSKEKKMVAAINQSSKTKETESVARFRVKKELIVGIAVAVAGLATAVITAIYG